MEGERASHQRWVREGERAWYNERMHTEHTQGSTYIAAMLYAKDRFIIKLVDEIDRLRCERDCLIRAGRGERGMMSEAAQAGCAGQ